MRERTRSGARPLRRAVWAVALLAGLAACSRSAPQKGGAGSPATKENAVPKSKTGEALLVFAQPFDGTLLAVTAGNAKLVKAPIRDGRAALPAGPYQSLSQTVEERDAQGGQWTAMTSYGWDGNPAPGSTTNVPGGPPFTAVVKVDGPKGAERFSMLLSGSNDAPLKFSRNDGPADPPGFEVLDESGKRVFTASFEYG